MATLPPKQDKQEGEIQTINQASPGSNPSPSGSDNPDQTKPPSPPSDSDSDSDLDSTSISALKSTAPPRKKEKIILGALGILLLLASVPAAVYLVQQRQDIRKMAQEYPTDTGAPPTNTGVPPTNTPGIDTPTPTGPWWGCWYTGKMCCPGVPEYCCTNGYCGCEGECEAFECDTASDCSQSDCETVCSDKGGCREIICWENVCQYDCWGGDQPTPTTGPPTNTPTPGEPTSTPPPTCWEPCDPADPNCQGSYQCLPVGGKMTYFGSTNDTPVPEDYNGDGKDDFAVHHGEEGDGFWKVYEQFNQEIGYADDIPAPADMSGDGQSELIIFQPDIMSDGKSSWWIMDRAQGITVPRSFGLPGDIPVVGNYNSDELADLALYRPGETATWLIWPTIQGASIETHELGTTGDIPVPADYDGDGQAEIAVYRPGETAAWLIQPLGGSVQTHELGTTGDIPVPADYDGDGKAEIAVYRPAETAIWYITTDSDYYCLNPDCVPPEAQDLSCNCYPSYNLDCHSAKLYDPDWNEISSPSINQTVYLAVKGITDEPGGITQARFRVKIDDGDFGDWQTTTDKNTDNDMFYVSYIIPSAGTYTVQAEVYNATLGWE